MNPEPFIRIRNDISLREATDAEAAVIFKHSPRCGISAMAFQEMLSFAAAHPRVPVYLVDVVGQPELSRRLAKLLGVRHASPQVIVIRDGNPAWDTSHFAVKAETLGELLRVRGGVQRGDA